MKKQYERNQRVYPLKTYETVLASEENSFPPFMIFVMEVVYLLSLHIMQQY